MGMMEEARAGHDLYAKFETTEGTVVVQLLVKRRAQDGRELRGPGHRREGVDGPGLG